MPYNIAAYITAYKDIDSVKGCINCIQKQLLSVATIFIVDNSHKQLIKYDVHPTIIINHQPDNIGISGGLNIAIKWAIGNNYDFLWAFDQDSKPLPDTLNQLIQYYNDLTNKGHNIGIIAPLPVDIKTGQTWNGIEFNRYKFTEVKNHTGKNEYYSCDAVITSGSLINLKAAKKVPLPKEELFIDAVDWDYCMQFRKHNYEVIVIQDIIFPHRFGNSYQIKTIFKPEKITIYQYSPLRYFYICRNYTFVETRLATQNNLLYKSISRRLYFLIIMMGKIILYERNNTWLKVWACIRGTYDGFIGKLGKTW